MKERWFRGYHNYYWVVDQARKLRHRNLIFTSRGSLAGLYARLLDHATINLGQGHPDFLGPTVRHPRFDGEVAHKVGRRDRWPGSRIKHRMKNNWLKMYDKFGPELVLRIETVINNPREFRVRRWRTREGRRELAWCPMNKSVISNLYRYREDRRNCQRTLPPGVVCGRESGLPGISAGQKKSPSRW